MAALSNHPGQHWRDVAIARSEVISDLWEVVKAYCGRLAEWVLFGCMIITIIEMFPGVSFAVWFTSTVISVQVIMLDVGGFALATMAEHAREQGDGEAADKAKRTGIFLITLMIVTLLLITAGNLYPLVKPFTDQAEKIMILIRIIMTVVYGHVIHSLRRSPALAIHPTQQPIQPVANDQIEALQKTVEELHTQLINATPTQSPLQVVEEPTHDLHTAIQPLKIRSTGVSTGLQLLAQVASATAPDDLLIEDEAAIEADLPASVQIDYPVVPGVSAEKVRQIINAHLSGTKWRVIPGNYSQTVKPVRDLWEALHPSIQPTQTV